MILKRHYKLLTKLLTEIKPDQNYPILFYRRSNSNNNVSNPLEIANKFNEYFVKIGPQLAKTIQKNYNITYESYLNGNSVESMFIEPVTEYELQIEINNTKSAGHDDISAKMIKIISEEIIKPLTYIYNLSFETGSEKYQFF